MKPKEKAENIETVAKLPTSEEKRKKKHKLWNSIALNSLFSADKEHGVFSKLNCKPFLRYKNTILLFHLQKRDCIN